MKKVVAFYSPKPTAEAGVVAHMVASMIAKNEAIRCACVDVVEEMDPTTVEGYFAPHTAIHLIDLLRENNDIVIIDAGAGPKNKLKEAIFDAADERIIWGGGYTAEKLIKECREIADRILKENEDMKIKWVERELEKILQKRGIDIEQMLSAMVEVDRIQIESEAEPTEEALVFSVIADILEGLHKSRIHIRTFRDANKALAYRDTVSEIMQERKG